METKWVVSGAAFATLCVRRDLATALCIFGAIVNALLAKLCKRLFNASRPDGAGLSDPGMPSSHAQSLFFFATYLSMMLDEPALSSVLRGNAYTFILSRLLPVAFFGAAAVLASLRVRAGLHTIAQVGVGACFGSAFGAGWVAAQPRLVRFVGERLHDVSSGALVALLIVGALVVGSVERQIAKQLKNAASQKKRK